MKTLTIFLTALFLTLPTLAALQPKDGVFRIGNDASCIFVKNPVGDGDFHCFEMDDDDDYKLLVPLLLWGGPERAYGTEYYAIESGYNHTCTYVNRGITCWEVNSDAPKSIGQKHKFSFGQNILTNKLLAKFVSKSRRDFLMGLQSADSICQNNPKKSYFQCKAFVNGLIGPSILSADSAIALNDIIPAYQVDMRYSLRQVDMQAEMRYSLRQEGMIYLIRELGAEILEKSPNTSTNRQYALSVISSALKVSLNFFTPEEQRLLKEALRTTGQALANPMDNARTIEVVRTIERLTLEKSALRESTKSAFLADVMDLSAQWLKGKVR